MFLLNMQSKEPIYEQIKAQIVSFINAGVMKSGDKLPSVRKLARDNGVNPNTVSKAYRELEEAGIIFNLPKKGAYVAGPVPAPPGQAASGGLGGEADAAYRAIAELKANGHTQEEILEAVKKVFNIEPTMAAPTTINEKPEANENA